MNRYLLLLIVSFLLQSLSAQPVPDLEKYYSGTYVWKEAERTLEFQSSGAFNFPGRKDLMEFRWDVPKEVSRIIINENVSVTGFFHLFNHTLIEGKDRATSVIYGTSEAGHLRRLGLDKVGARSVPYSTFYAKGDFVIRVQNLTVLNPFSFMFTGKSSNGGHAAVFHLYQVSGIDDRGGHSNHSDGVSAGGGTTVRDCYFECGDDVFKVYQDIYVENTTVKMIKNAVPIQLGWHNNNTPAIGVFRNLKIIGDLGRGGTGNAIINARNGRYDKTLIFDGLHIENPNATLLDLWNNDHNGVKGGGKLTIRMDNSDIQVAQFSKRWNMDVNMEICSQIIKQVEQRTTFNCQIP